MNFIVDGAETFCYTGGKVFDPEKPTVILIHGVLNDHSVWILQSRYLANHGWNVLAVDLPGHCRSKGEPTATVEQAADFIAGLMNATNLKKAALVGHSWGSLIALEAAARLKHRISHLVLVGIAFPMQVSPVLLDASLNDPQKGIQLMNIFMRSTLAAPPSVLGPGTWVRGSSTALNRRVLASNSDVNLYHLGFQACNSYANGEQAITEITCPVLFVLGVTDQMTPPKAAKKLIAAAENANKDVTLVHLPVGHHQMEETPDPTLFALREFMAG